MANDAVTAFLAQHAVLSMLKDAERAQLAEACEVATHPHEDKIFHQGEVGDAMYVVKQGLVRIFKKTEEGEQTIVLAKPGEFIGEMALFDNYPRSAGAKAMGETELVKLSKENYEKLKKEHPDTAVKLLEVFLRLLSKRLRATTAKMYGDFDTL